MNRSAAWLLLLGCACGAGAPAHTAQAGQPRAAPGAEPFARAQRLLDAGDTLRAEQYALLALRRGHPEEPTRTLLVHACLRSDRLRAALDYAEPFLRRRPGHARLRYLVATVQLALGRPSLARDELARAARLAPSLPEPHYLAGIVARDAFGDLAGAREAFERYLALAPQGDHADELRAWLAEAPARDGAQPAPAPLDEGS